MVSARILLGSAGLVAVLAPTAAFADGFVLAPQIHVHLGGPRPAPVPVYAPPPAPAPVYVPAPVVVVRPAPVPQPIPVGTTGCPGPVVEAGWFYNSQAGMRVWTPAHCAPVQPVAYVPAHPVSQPCAMELRHDHGRHEGWAKQREREHEHEHEHDHGRHGGEHHGHG